MNNNEENTLSLEKSLRPERKLMELHNQVRELEYRISAIDDSLKEIKTTGGCGNISLCRHSDTFESNTKQIIALDYKSDDKHIIDYFLNKLETKRKALTDELNAICIFFEKAAQLYDEHVGKA